MLEADLTQEAMLYGVELGISSQLIRDDRLGLEVSFEHSRYTDFFVSSEFGPTGRVAVPGGVRYDGEGIPLISKWSGTMSYDHIFRFIRGGSLDASVSSYFRTDFWGSIDRSNPNNHLGGFTNTAMHLAFTPNNGR